MQKYNKVKIFLDFDGVISYINFAFIASGDTLKRQSEKDFSKNMCEDMRRYMSICPMAISNLRSFIETIKVPVEFIISSTWRHYRNEWFIHFIKHLLPTAILGGKTSDDRPLNLYDRKYQIEQYINNDQDENILYYIIDDEHLCPENNKNDIDLYHYIDSKYKNVFQPAYCYMQGKDKNIIMAIDYNFNNGFNHEIMEIYKIHYQKQQGV